MSKAITKGTRERMPFGAFILRDVGFRSRCDLAYVSHDGLVCGRMAWLEQTHAESRGYVVGTRVRRLRARELRAWRAAGNYVPRATATGGGR
jgi:hypothetical protein